MTRVPVAEGILGGSLEEPVLLGGRCGACEVVTFPAQGSCPRCTGEEMAVTPLPRRGTLWTWTVQRFPPKSPPYSRVETDETFVPFALGYVELGGDVRVEARLVGADADSLAIGMEMELVVVALRQTVDGDEVVVPAFRPVAAGD